MISFVIYLRKIIAQSVYLRVAYVLNTYSQMAPFTGLEHGDLHD